MTAYAAAVESLYLLGAELAVAKPRRKFDLEQMRRLVEGLGHPERRFPSVLIAGTNGKGSTSATLASILAKSGYKTGLYTSPHLIRVNERIRVDGVAIDESEFAAAYEHVHSVAQELLQDGTLPALPSFFETMTAMAFEHFANVGVDIAVLEVGLGGRLDATNIVDPLVAVITDVDLDHQQWLGETITEIAREKAGILRPGGRVVLLPQHPEANTAIGEVAMAIGAHAINASDLLPPTVPDADTGNIYRIKWEEGDVLMASPLHGRHQWRNLALALGTARELRRTAGLSRITPASVEQGVRETRWPGRLQWLRYEGHSYVLDVAHNPAGAWALRSALHEFGAETPITLIFGAMQDKRIDEIASILFPVADKVVLTRAHSPRAAAPEQIAEWANHTGAEFTFSEDVPSALRQAASADREGGIIVVTGSVFVVGEALAILSPESAL